MVAVVILGILASVAYPSFMQSMRKSKRSVAEAALLNASANQERFFAISNTYTTDVTNLGLPSNGHTEGDYYTMSVAAGGTGIASSYVITATATTGTTQADDTGCTVLTLNSVGVRTPDPDTSDCW